MDVVDLKMAMGAVLTAGSEISVTANEQLDIADTIEKFVELPNRDEILLQATAIAAKAWAGRMPLASLDLQRAVCDVFFDGVPVAEKAARERAARYDKGCKKDEFSSRDLRNEAVVSMGRNAR